MLFLKSVIPQLSNGILTDAIFEAVLVIFTLLLLL